MNRVIIRRIATKSTSTLRPFHEIFPRKRLINRILFELDSNDTYKTLYPNFETLYLKHELPSTVSGPQLLLMDRVLLEVSKQQKMINEVLMKMRGELLELAAGKGENDAISTVCYNILSSPKDDSKGDAEDASRLIGELVKAGNVLTFKHLGDLSRLKGDINEAKLWYDKFMECVDQDETRVSDVSIIGQVLERLGEIEFNQSRVLGAEKYWLDAIARSKLEDSVKSYFYLSKVYLNSEPLKSRVLLENCATQGFRESFKELGYLELNYFKNLVKANEWFRLGMELFEIECFFGFFDSCYQLKEYKSCSKCLKSLETFKNINESYKKYGFRIRIS
ncbi:hypothetical protein NCAS_0B05990 [Naumovozyma castellii]|uniref:Protein MSS2, mitochondrial n=1 Tax=Naumovozyma castellii TaxID=27288 RepID=G0V9R6_NAUCA|nr:hypothetical protein NCAS_0B05990 [Naumovozyma castellii CBS 4309]CCC68683.1 hypothetical protein NCAS_0B05990 [Naumovozyma castellii CBS 4309]